jgi:hypothetical protein
VEEKEERELRVPLPPSFGYQLNESDDEEEEGPPGMLPMKMPPMQKKVRKFNLKALSHEMNLAFDDIYG